ncbi:MAG: gamma-glutamyltransferase [bacterium]
MISLLKYRCLIVVLFCTGLFSFPDLSVHARDLYQPVYAHHGMVAGPEEHAVRAGVEVLQQGGNAFDAAAAVGFALAVTYPQAGNLGGGGFLIAKPVAGDALFLDFREVAPASATQGMYLDDQGEIIAGLSTETLLAVGVPGTVHGLLRIVEDYGKLSRQQILTPAVRLADEGFVVSRALHHSLKYQQKRLSRFPSTRQVFFPQGNPIATGEILQQPDLASTLRQIQQDGSRAFYEGAIAGKLVEFMQGNGGLISLEDLKNYRSRYREPIIFTYDDYTLIAPSLPSSGGITLAMMLKLLEPMNLSEMGYLSADYVHAIVECERLAFADRNFHLGDTDFVQVPVEQLLSDEYINLRRARIPVGKAGQSADIKPGKPEAMETTHYCVVDAEGNVAAVTYTLNGSFGMGAVAEGLGFLLNNEMDDFTARAGEPNMFGLVQGTANAIEPGKRMLSSMTPLIVMKDGEFAFTIGTPGGPTIITTDLQIFLNMVEFGMNIRTAIDARRFHHQWLPDEILHERFIPAPETCRKLKSMGYELKETGSIGFAAGIQRMEDGTLAGYADGRGTGAALGY